MTCAMYLQIQIEPSRKEQKKIGSLILLDLPNFFSLIFMIFVSPINLKYANVSIQLIE